MIRVLPAVLGENVIEVVPQHYIQTPSMKFGKSVTCAYAVSRKRCIICDYVNHLKSTGNPADYELAEESQVRRNAYTYIIDRKQEEKGPQIFAVKYSMLGTLSELRAASGDFADPYKGYDLMISRKGTTKNDTKYTILKGPECPLSDDPDMLEALLDALPTKAAMSAVLPESAVMALCNGDLDDIASTPSRAALPAKQQARQAPRGLPKARNVVDDIVTMGGTPEGEDDFPYDGR